MPRRRVKAFKPLIDIGRKALNEHEGSNLLCCRSVIVRLIERGLQSLQCRVSCGRYLHGQRMNLLSALTKRWEIFRFTRRTFLGLKPP